MRAFRPHCGRCGPHCGRCGPCLSTMRSFGPQCGPCSSTMRSVLSTMRSVLVHNADRAGVGWGVGGVGGVGGDGGVRGDGGVGGV